MDETRQLLFDRIYNTHTAYIQSNYDFWVHHSLNTGAWWLLVFVLVIPGFVWWKLIDRKRLFEITFYGVLVMFSITAMSGIGVSSQLWTYPIKLLPKFPHVMTLDTVLVPIIYMLVYQYFPRWKWFAVAAMGAALLYSLAVLPFAEWLGIYYRINWEHWYGPILYFLIAALMKSFLLLLEYMQEDNTK